jgi:glycosyltransferase involved in cell wall biosynthesis
VLVLAKTTALGGAERLLINTLPYLDRRSFDYRFAALDGGGPLARSCAEAGLSFAALPLRGTLDPRAIWRLRGRLCREQIDLIHAHLPLPGALARLAARGLPTRVVYTEHSTQDVYRRASRWFNAASYGWQDAVVAVSGRVRASAEARVGPRARGRIAVVPNGVDLAAMERAAAPAPRPLPPRIPGGLALLVPANLTPVKGHDVLLRSLNRLGEGAGRPFDVWLAGDGGSRAALESRARRTPVHGRVHFLGRRDDIFALMRAADLVVLPSRREGHPLALLEALALGRPAVACTTGGIPEIVTHGRTGWLVPPEDPAALAAALVRLASDPDLRRRLGEEAARDARHRFDVRRTVAQIEAVYRRTLSEGEREERTETPSPDLSHRSDCGP